MVEVFCARCGSPREGNEVKCKICGGYFKIKINFPYKKGDMKENFPYIKEWVTLGEWNTPLIKINENLYFKLDYLNPTGSYKDRGAVTLISYLKQKGIKRISEDSSGNAGSAIAAYAARAGIEALIYVPETARGNKLRQIEAYGAKAIRVKGSREEVARQAENSGAHYASHVLNPEFRDGIRTLSYEISRDLYWSPPDLVFLPLSAGTLLLGVYEGFKHLLESGVIEKIPKIIAVQTDQVMPVCAKLKGISYTPPQKITSIADALVSTNPVLIEEIVKVLRENGDCIVVNDQDIISAHSKLARSGFFVEYSSATVYSAFEKYSEEEKLNSKVVLVLTGHGLKTV